MMLQTWSAGQTLGLWRAPRTANCTLRPQPAYTNTMIRRAALCAVCKMATTNQACLEAILCCELKRRVLLASVHPD